MNLAKYYIPFDFYRLILFILIIPSCLCAQEHYITESYLIRDISSCDIDLDGDNDLIISSYSNDLPDSLFIFYNDGIGCLNKTSLCRQNSIFVLCGNVDGDEYPDIITKGGGNILFIKNNGDGTFGEEIEIAPSEGSKIIEYVADMDEDDLNDLVYTYNGYYCKWGILKNEGELFFTDHIIYDDGMGTNLFPIIGNLNNDNLPDASLTFTSEGIHVLMNNGDLTFDSLLLCSTKGYPAICSLDLNPPEDILVLGPNTDELILFENMGNNVFMVRNTLPLIDALGLMDVTDFNNDGYDDLSYSICWWNACTDSIYIRINDQNWNFYEPQQYFVAPMELFSTETADLNGDNFNDIIMYGYSPRNAFKILWNDGDGSFSYENPVGIGEKLYSGNQLKLEANPNPFNDRTSINYNLDHEASIQINIFNNLGQLVETITEMGKPKGNYSYDFDASEFNTGIYFCTLIINGKAAASIKMMVL